MKKVLMISYAYPPQSGSGVVRVLKFSKYLPKFGWNPYVVSVKRENVNGNESIPPETKVYYTRNLLPLDFLFERIAKRVNAEITDREYSGEEESSTKLVANILKSIKTAKTFIIPDTYVGWIPRTLKKAREIIQKEDINVIYATSPPPTAVIIGALLKKLSGKPLVVDFRDPWIRNHNLTYITSLNRFLESFVVKTADYVIVNRPRMEREFLSDHPYLKDKIGLLCNGFDFDDLPKNVKPFNKFTITYTGTFGGTRSPVLFLNALRKIIEDNKISRSEIQVIFVGSGSSIVNEFASQHGLDDIIKQTEYLPQKEALEIVFKSQMLLLVEFSDSFPGKVFEYLSSGIPLLAIITKGELETLIRENSDDSYIITSQSVGAIGSAILDHHIKWKSSPKYESNKKTIEFKKEYNRENLTRELCVVLDEVYQNDAK